MRPLFIIAYAIVSMLLTLCRFISRLFVSPLCKAHYYLAHATAIKRGTIVKQSEHRDKSRGPWIIVSFSYDGGDYYLVKPEFFKDMKETGTPSYSAGEYCWVYPKYLKIIGNVTE